MAELIQTDKTSMAERRCISLHSMAIQRLLKLCYVMGELTQTEKPTMAKRH